MARAIQSASDNSRIPPKNLQSETQVELRVQKTKNLGQRTSAKVPIFHFIVDDMRKDYSFPTAEFNKKIGGWQRGGELCRGNRRRRKYIEVLKAIQVFYFSSDFFISHGKLTELLTARILLAIAVNP